MMYCLCHSDRHNPSNVVQLVGNLSGSIRLSRKSAVLCCRRGSESVRRFLLILSFPEEVDGFFGEASIGVEEVAEDGHEDEEEAGDGEEGEEDEGGEVGASEFADVVDEPEEADAEDGGDEEEGDGEKGEEASGAIEQEHGEHGAAGFFEVLGDALKKSRGPGSGVDADIDGGDADAGGSGLDEGLHAVGEAGVDEDALAGHAGEGTEAGGGIADGGAGDPAEGGGACELESLLYGGELGVFDDGSVAYDDVGLIFEDGDDEFCDIGAAVLVIGVGIDEDVGSAGEGGLDAGGEGGGEAAIAAEGDDVLDAEAAGDFDGVVGGAIVDDLDFDGIDAWDGFGEVRNGFGEGFLFVEAGNLDDEFHGGLFSFGCFGTLDGAFAEGEFGERKEDHVDELVDEVIDVFAEDDELE